MPNELILVMDDEPDILRLCDRILSADGYSVYTADSGRQAIDIARETPLDAVLLDIKIPDSDGITVFKTIRKYQPEVVGVVITGYPSMEAAIEALRHGISGFVLKPFTPNELRQAVTDALERQYLERDYARLQALIPLYDLSRTLMGTIEIDQLLEQVVELAIQETQADRASVMLEREGMLYMEAARGMPENIKGQAATPVGEGIAGWVAQHGEPLLLDPSVSMPPKLEDALTRDEIASAVCAPLSLHDRVIGVLNLTKFDPTERRFTPSERDLITVLAGQVAIAIENARLFRRQRTLTQELSRANANLRALQQATTAITSRLSPDRVQHTILDGCAAVMPDATIALGLLSEQGPTIEVHLQHRESNLRETRTLSLLSAEAQTTDARSNASEMLDQQLRTLLADLSGANSIDVIPLSAREQVLGALAVATQQAWSEADISILTPFADQAAVALANAQLFTRLQEAYEELQEIDRLKHEFVDLAVRKLRSPLSVIKAYGQVLDNVSRENIEPELSRISEAAAQLETHIENLASLRKLEAGGPALQQRVDVRELLSPLVTRIRPFIEDEGQTLEFDVPSTLSAIEADPAKFELVIANLLLNAVQGAQQDDTIKLEAKTTETDLYVTIWATGSEALGQLGEPEVDYFLKAVDPLARELDEESAGLSAAQRFAERLGGRIEMETVPGRGNSVSLVLPLPDENSNSGS